MHLVGFVVLVLFGVAVWCLLRLYGCFGFWVVCGIDLGYGWVLVLLVACVKIVVLIWWGLLL